MSLIKKILFYIAISIISFPAFAEEVKKVGKYKDWETMVLVEATGNTCFAQSSPVLQAPKSNKRDARLFVSFRPGDKIADEISTTPGYEFNKNNKVIATSGKNKFNFDFSSKFEISIQFCVEQAKHFHI